MPDVEIKIDAVFMGIRRNAIPGHRDASGNHVFYSLRGNLRRQGVIAYSCPGARIVSRKAQRSICVGPTQCSGVTYRVVIPVQVHALRCGGKPLLALQRNAVRLCLLLRGLCFCGALLFLYGLRLRSSVGGATVVLGLAQSRCAGRFFLGNSLPFGLLLFLSGNPLLKLNTFGMLQVEEIAPSE